MRELIATIKFNKSKCGVDFMINTADNTEKRAWSDHNEIVSEPVWRLSE